MIRVLLAVADAQQSRRLGARFEASFGERLQLEEVGGALYALTSLERVRADLIVSSETLDDMTGRDLFEIICDDDALRQTPFILLSDTQSAPPPEHTIFVMLDAQADPSDVLASAFTLLLRSGKLAEQGARADVKMSGTFEALTLFDIVGSLKHSKRSGQLIVTVDGAEAVMQLREGRLIHASCEHAVGEEAVTTIFARADHDPEAEFRFESSAEVLAAQELVTIDTPVDKLLLQVAVALDEQRRVQV